MCKLEWDPCAEEGGSPIYSYDVFVRETGDTDWSRVNGEEVFTTTYRIRDTLKPGHSYEFKIEATNEAGISSNSNLASLPVLCPEISGEVLMNLFGKKLSSCMEKDFFWKKALGRKKMTFCGIKELLKKFVCIEFCIK